MKILLTNDDGIRAPGLAAALKVLRRLGDVTVVAPETVQSAAGHGITLGRPLMTWQVPVDDQTVGTSVEGRPADCVKLALHNILPEKPDLVVSGINSGANVGINVIYSGTVAAALEGAFLGTPAIALSLLLDRNVPDYDHAAELCMVAIEKILHRGLKAGQVMSVNVPTLKSPEKPRGYKLVRQCTRPFNDSFEKRSDPRGNAYYWSTAEFKLLASEDDTDVAALRDGFVTITPLMFDLTDARRMSELGANREL
jgi:5'-nucleotidase